MVIKAMPSYIKDIFNQILSPCLTSPDGKSRLDATTAAQNIRKKIFVTHCHGGYIVYRLEDMMQKKMTSLGYSADEQNLIFN